MDRVREEESTFRRRTPRHSQSLGGVDHEPWCWIPKASGYGHLALLQGLLQLADHQLRAELTKPSSGEFCNECLAKEKAGNCT
jgi:hypothetical protein